MLHLNQNGMESDYNSSDDVIGNGHMILGLKTASKALEIIHDIELGKSNMLPVWVGTQ
jgi:hypothetical protein